jgi:hypothetical protein
MKSVFLLSILSCLSTSFAGDCILHVKRTACPGNDTESFKKCDGKAECEEKKSAGSLIECAKIATDDCANARFLITKSKAITAKFDGAPVMGGKNFCKEDRPDFNKCK